MTLFRSGAEHFRFLEMVEAACEATPATLAGYLFFRESFVLLLEATLKERASCMGRLGSVYSRVFNRRHGLSGRSFRGPYRSWRLEKGLLGTHALANMVSRPVQLGLVRKPEAYRWSCARDLLGLPGSPWGVNPRIAMGCVDPDPGVARKRLLEEIDRELARSRPFGFRESRFARILEHAQEEWDESGGINARDAALYWGRQADVPIRSMASVLQEASPQRLRQALLCLNRRLEGSPSLRERMRPPWNQPING